MIIEITKGGSAGEVVEVSDEKGARMIAAAVAKASNKKPRSVAKKASNEAK